MLRLKERENFLFIFPTDFFFNRSGAWHRLRIPAYWILTADHKHFQWEPIFVLVHFFSLPLRNILIERRKFRKSWKPIMCLDLNNSYQNKASMKWVDSHALSSDVFIRFEIFWMKECSSYFLKEMKRSRFCYCLLSVVGKNDYILLLNK